MEKGKVAAIVLNYNSSLDCGKCIDFLEKQDYENLKIIVVDNASSDPGEKEELQCICEGKGIQLIFNPTNGGFSAGNNVGLRAAVEEGAEWMLIINPDVELRDPHYITYVMEQIPKWPEAAVVGTNVLIPSGERQNPMRELTMFEEIMWPLEIIRIKRGKWEGYRAKNETGYCEKLNGCCFFVSNKFLQKNNYLDETVFLYCEEPILAKSVVRAGYKELYIKEVTANHEHYIQNKSGSSKTKMPIFLKSRIYYIKKYSGYGFWGIKVAIFSRRVQGLLWKFKIDKRSR